MIRTSLTHPLRIDEIPLARGRLGLTLAPGRQGASAGGPPWRRDLGLDLQAIRGWRPSLVITLLTPVEMAAIGIPDLGPRLRAAGCDWLSLPLEDGTAPGAAWLDGWQREAPRLHHLLEAGGRILIHCRAGLERAPTLAALLMLSRGIPLGIALDRIATARPGARPLPAQIAALARAFPPLSPRAAQLRACLLGGALGDAMGAAIEFWPLARIRRVFPRGIDRFLPEEGSPGAVTDDTQMTLFTAEGLIRAMLRGLQRGLCDPPSVVHHALLRWARTQGLQADAELCDQGLLTDRRLWQRRAPGTTCLSALAAPASFGSRARNASKGCGTIMRVAPAAFFPAADPWELASDLSRLTHGHPTAAEAAACFAEILHRIAAGEALEAAATAALRRSDPDGEAARSLRAALAAPRDGGAATVEALGAGWVAEEALAIAVYAGLCATGLDHGLQIALLHSGDSDSTGAIAGNLLGLMFPQQVAAHPLAAGVEGADLIERLARDLAILPELLSRLPDSLPDELLERYPGW
jgi:ADP-ribosylglycohydrolase